MYSKKMRLIVGFLVCFFGLHLQCMAVDCSQANPWKDMIITKGFEETAGKFRDRIDVMYEKKIQKIKKRNFNFKCESEEEVSEKIEVGDFQKELVKEYADYQCALLYAYQHSEVMSLNGTHFDIFARQRGLKELVAKEVEDTGKAFQVAFFAFSEMEANYLIHKRLECLIDSTTGFRDQLNRFVEQVVKVGPKFINCGYQK
jgi:hypothetical protein